MRRRAFTLIELSVLITVLAILAVAIMPNLSNMKISQEHRDFRFGVRRLAVQAREQAILRKEPLEFRVDESGERLVVQTLETEEESPSEIASIAAPENVTIDRFDTAEGSSDASAWAVRFEPDGSASPGGVVFTSGNDQFYLVVRGDGRASLDWGEMPAIEDEEWEAGEIEQRL